MNRFDAFGHKISAHRLPSANDRCSSTSPPYARLPRLQVAVRETAGAPQVPHKISIISLRLVESIQIDSNRFKFEYFQSIFNQRQACAPSTHITMRHTPLRAVGGVTPSTLTPVLIIGDHSSRTRRSLCSSRCCSHAARAHIQFARIHPFAMCMHASCAAQPAEPGAIDSNK